MNEAIGQVLSLGVGVGLSPAVTDPDWPLAGRRIVPTG
jgi:hypothetical protein